MEFAGCGTVVDGGRKEGGWFSWDGKGGVVEMF